jgi:hypothetical protein
MILDAPDALTPAEEQARVDDIVAKGPYGALSLAVSAVCLVLALWFAFYFLVFLPRA